MAEITNPTTPEELLAVIRDACAMDVPAGFDPEHPDRDTLASGYEQSAEALVTCALAAFQYAAREVGATGFQGSWALMQILWRGNGWDGPGLVLKAADNVYPQYEHPADKAREWFESDETQRWLRDEARRLLAERGEGVVNGWVADHWIELAAMDVPEGAARG